MSSRGRPGCVGRCGLVLICDATSWCQRHFTSPRRVSPRVTLCVPCLRREPPLISYASAGHVVCVAPHPARRRPNVTRMNHRLRPITKREMTSGQQSRILSPPSHALRSAAYLGAHRRLCAGTVDGKYRSLAFMAHRGDQRQRLQHAQRPLCSPSQPRQCRPQQAALARPAAAVAAAAAVPVAEAAAVQVQDLTLAGGDRSDGAGKVTGSLRSSRWC